ncbi:MAG: GumC family protein, partial [Calditrichaeota bacterium]|nr:GumC family protein [Calditrichota bacterium]
MMQEPLEQQVTLNDYLRVLYRGRWIIAIAFLATVLATAYFTFTTEPIYEASATVMVKEEGSGVSDMLFGGVASAFRRETEINNQVQILKSRTLAEAVIRRLQQSPYADKLRILGNVPEDVRRSFNPVSAAMGLVTGLFGGKNQQTTQPTGDELVSVLAEDLQKRIKISPVRDTDMIHIKFDAPSPFEAAYVTNAIAQTYREQNIEESRAEVKQVKEFLEGQLPAIKKQLESAEERLKQYQEQRGVYALDKETEKLVEQISEAEALYQEALTDLQSNEKRLAYVDSLLAASKTNIDVETIASEPYLEEIRKQIAQLEIARSDYISSLIENGVYTKDDPKLQEYDRRLQQLNKKFQEEVAKIAAAEMPNPLAVSSDVFKSKIEIEAELRSLRPRVKALKAIRDRYRQRLESVPAKALELARLKREALVNEKIYTMMQEKYEESRITEVGQLGKVRIVDPARPPRYPVKPKKKLNLMLAGIIGLMLGVGIAFVIEYMDNSIRSPEEVERLGLPLLGTIPVIAEEEEDSSKNNGRLRLRPGASNGDEEAQQLS